MKPLSGEAIGQQRCPAMYELQMIDKHFPPEDDGKDKGERSPGKR